MSVCTNTAFIGIPVVSAICGSGAVFSASIFVLVSNISIFSIGFMILGSGRPKGMASGQKNDQGLLSALKSLLNPSTIACVLAIVIFFASIHFPSFINDTLNSVGGITGPMAQASPSPA